MFMIRGAWAEDFESTLTHLVLPSPETEVRPAHAQKPSRTNPTNKYGFPGILYGVPGICVVPEEISMVALELDWNSGNLCPEFVWCPWNLYSNLSTPIIGPCGQGQPATSQA